MRKILTINKPTTYPKEANHSCLLSLELDNPLSRIDAPAAIMQLEAKDHIISIDQVRVPFLRIHANTLFRIAGMESYVTVLEGYNHYIRYDITEIADDAAWMIHEKNGGEALVVAGSEDVVIEKDEKTGYCKDIQCVVKNGRVGKASW